MKPASQHIRLFRFRGWLCACGLLLSLTLCAQRPVSYADQFRLKKTEAGHTLSWSSDVSDPTAVFLLDHAGENLQFRTAVKSHIDRPRVYESSPNALPVAVPLIYEFALDTLKGPVTYYRLRLRLAGVTRVISDTLSSNAGFTHLRAALLSVRRNEARQMLEITLHTDAGFVASVKWDSELKEKLIVKTAPDTYKISIPLAAIPDWGPQRPLRITLMDHLGNQNQLQVGELQE